MSKKLILLLFLVFLSSFGLAQAQVVINEVQVLPTGEKFLELYNNSDSAVDLTGWNIKKKTSSGTESTLVATSRLEGKTILAGEYFLIANETGYTGSIALDASWPPSNSGLASNNTVLIYQGETLIDKLGWGEASDCISPCPANPETGQSLQKVANSWITATPTPGQANQESTPPPASSSGGGGASPASSATNTTTKPPEPQKIRTQILTKNVAFAGQPFTIEGVAYGTTGEKLSYGRYFWNFGDGSSREVQNRENNKFTHKFFYPGDYTVSLEFYLNYYGDNPDATTQVNIRVVSTDITISNVGDERDFFIELSKNASYDIDISKWMLSGFNRVFSFPKNTILGAKKKIVFPGRVTGFIIQDKDTLKLLDSEGQVMFDYGGSFIQDIAPLPEKKITANIPRVYTPASTVEEIEEKYVSEPVADSLNASVLSSEVATKNSYVPIIAFGVLLALSAGAVYAIRRDKNTQKTGDDFELLDE